MLMIALQTCVKMVERALMVSTLTVVYVWQDTSESTVAQVSTEDCYSNMQ